nr:glycosyltransferase family 4 protein [uncultured Celeribacter sp.]
MIRIAHLVDDQNPGGVTRYLDFIAHHPAMRDVAQHDIIPVSRAHPGRVKTDADLIVSHLTITWRGLPGLMALRARYPNTPLVHVEHSYCKGFIAPNVRHHRRFFTLLRTAYALFESVVAVSQTQSQWLARHGLVTPEALYVISPCVPLAPFTALNAPATPPRRIAAIGRLDRQKGFDLLITAFRNLPQEDLTLDLYGDGPEREFLERLAQSDPRIRFHGHVAPETALARCDAVAMPSRWEPYGLVALEAQAAGRQVLLSNTDGLRDQAARGLHLVCEPTEAAWTRALLELSQGEIAAPHRISTAPEVHCAEAWKLLIDWLCPQSQPGTSDMVVA